MKYFGRAIRDILLFWVLAVLATYLIGKFAGNISKSKLEGSVVLS